MKRMQHASALLIFLTFLSPLPAEPPQVLAEFPIFSDGDVLLLPVQFAGKQYQFMLDTGATDTVYDSTFRARLGDPIKKRTVETPKGKVQLLFFQALEASVGKMSLRTKQPIICADLKLAREASGHQIMGVVGLDFLRQHRIRIDFDAGRLEFLDLLEAEPGTPIPLTLRHFYHAKATVAEEEEQFMIDTGCCGFSISGDLSAKLRERLVREKEALEVSEGYSTDLSGASEDQRMTLKNFVLGPFTHHQLCFGSAVQRNVLGLNYLSRYIVTFDFPNQKMYLKKGKRFDQPNVWDYSGLAILRIDGQTVVTIVDSGSPAARAGIEPKDILLKLDKLDADKTRLHVLRQRLARENETVRLRLRRGDKERELDLKLGK
jgi:predicted aspartyl protease